MTTPQPLFLPSLRTVAPRYRGIILDLWGVVHDGVAAFPEAIVAIRELRASGLRIALVSNAPRRARAVADRLAEMGIPAADYDHLLTSGEETLNALADPAEDWLAALGGAYHHLGPPMLESLLDGTRFRRVDDLDQAGFVLCTGSDGSSPIASYEDILAAARARALPMLCANPDLTVHIGEQLVLCAGSIAQRYEAMGGHVRYIGKPYPDIYRRVLDKLSLAPSAVLAIGDSLRTDIAGANAADIDAALVVSGVHRDELGADQDGRPGPNRLSEIVRDHGGAPRYVIPRFRW